jgi:hypothetical protein
LIDHYYLLILTLNFSDTDKYIYKGQVVQLSKRQLYLYYKEEMKLVCICSAILLVSTVYAAALPVSSSASTSIASKSKDLNKGGFSFVSEPKGGLKIVLSSGNYLFGRVGVTHGLTFFIIIRCQEIKQEG